MLTYTHTGNVKKSFTVEVHTPNQADIHDGNIVVTVDRHANVLQVSVQDKKGSAVPFMASGFYSGDAYKKTHCNFVPYIRAVDEAFSRYDREARVLDEISETQRRLDDLKTKARAAGLDV